MKAIVTGAYGAIGKAIVSGISGKGFEVLMTGRSEAKLSEAKEEILNCVPGARLTLCPVDLSDITAIAKLASAWKGTLHLLVNNAATAPRRRTETDSGTEMQFAVNVLAYHWMIRHFFPLMTDPAFARIVNIASYWAGGLDLEDPEFHRRQYNNDTAYRQSKQADRMLTAAWAARLKERGITVNACHPGDVNSKLSNDLGFGGHESPDQGADTPVWLATSPEVKGITGKYFENRCEQRCMFMADRKGVDALFGLCDSRSSG